MANLFINLPIPVVDGAGTAVSTAAMGKDKTITVAGSLGTSVINVEASCDGGVTFVTVATFTGVGGKRVIELNADTMRLNAKDILTASGMNCDIGASDEGASFVTLPIAVTDGFGAAVDISALGGDVSILVSGVFPGASLSVEVSEDGVDFVTCSKLFSGIAGWQSKKVTGNWMRTKVLGRSGAAFTAVVAVGGDNSASSISPSVRTDGVVLDVYVDSVNGSDNNDGLSQATALETFGALYEKFSLDMYGGSGLIVNLVNDTAAVVQYVVDGYLRLGEGGRVISSNPVVYRGPEMILFVPATGPSTAALDVVPAVRVDQTGTPSGTGNQTRLDFTAAAPGWTPNDFRRRFVRVTRGASRVFDELPISSNGASSLTVDTTGIVGNILATDTVEIVETAVHIVGGAADFANLSILKKSGASGIVGVLPDALGATFTRIAFDEIICEDVSGVQFDRCHFSLNNQGGTSFTRGSVAFKNCIASWELFLLGATETPVASVAGDTPLNAAAVGVTQLDGALHIGSANPIAYSAGIGIFIPTHTYSNYGDGIRVNGVGSKLVQKAGIPIIGAGSQFGIRCSNGGVAHVLGGTETEITGTSGDLSVGTGAAVSYGTAAGEFEEVAGWNGNFTRMLEGTPTAPTGTTSRITTAATLL